jgi:hypothetical protein
MTQDFSYILDRVVISKPSGCWLWQGFINNGGYGTAYSQALGKSIVAHRLSWMLSTGREIPPGLVIHHSCHVRPCVNPAHLHPVTEAENVRMQRPTGGRYGTPPARKKLYPWPSTIEELKVRTVPNAETGCWIWQQALNSGGYGRLWRPRPHRRLEQAHRVAWELVNGSIPQGLVVDHLCFTRACINPDHLQLLTRADNVRRKVMYTLPTCSRGHLWADHTGWERRGDKTARYCRQCRSDLRRARDRRPRLTERRHMVIPTERLVELRAQGLSQSQVGAVVGMTQGNVGKRLRKHDAEQAS